ncbi:carbohydrate ABC transporter permease [Arthrobacter oryzae]|uniref:Multiple sugar transport system permease protein n=1 Tax=Arthrobacter oryzae TaxID=409290 RepID=A0A495ETZ4_9MICC|nr:carbohydrate ABC transporter permease [Arthrobacter oryzae]RKR19806.1 multiple sugar transport system permease protein [Arthrobacter oryzae]
MMHKTTLPGRTAKFGFLGLWLVITLFPLYWITVTALKSPGAIYKFPLQYWPEKISFDNFAGLFNQANFGLYMVNSLVAASVSGAVVTVISLLAGYIIARFEFASKGAVVMAFLVTQMIPAFIALGPLYMMMTNLNLVDTRGGLIVVYIAMCIPFSTIMLRGFFDNVPDALEEAAMIDGCSRLVALFRVLVPVMLPGITAAFIFNFVNCWNELFLSVTLMNSDSNKTVPTAISGFITSYNIEWGPMSAAAVMTVVPTLIMFAFASKYIVQGLTAGAVKG